MAMSLAGTVSAVSGVECPKTRLRFAGVPPGFPMRTNAPFSRSPTAILKRYPRLSAQDGIDIRTIDLPVFWCSVAVEELGLNVARTIAGIPPEAWKRLENAEDEELANPFSLRRTLTGKLGAPPIG